MTGETQDGWKTKFPEEAADLEWWEAAFGKGNIAGWTGRSRAVVKLSGTLREVDPALREWAVESRALGPALDTVLEAVEAMPKERINRAMEPIGPRGPMGYRDVVLTLLRALRAEQSAGAGGETERS